MSRIQPQDSDNDIRIIPDKSQAMPDSNAQLLEEILSLPKRMQVTKDSPIKDYPTNLDISNPDHKALFLNALTIHDTQLAVGELYDMDVSYFVAHPASAVNDQTGEVKHFVRMILMDKVKGCFATTSAVVIARVHIMNELYTKEQWEQGIPVSLTARKSKRPGRTWHDITIRT